MVRLNNMDKTLERNYTQKWQFLIADYELVKEGKHSQFRFVYDFYRHHNINRQTFMKYYNRYKQQGDKRAFLPQKRGPKYKSRLLFIENKVINERKKGINRYEIHQILLPLLKDHTPSPSQIYRICKKYNLNKLTPKMKQYRRRIIKEKAGELGHIDTHHLSRDLLLNEGKQRYYVVAIIDDCTRLAWAEVVTDIKSLSVMFASLKSINMLNVTYGIQFKEMMSDNGPEFSSKNNKEGHAFERMLLELGIKHRYTRPYRPQTNGKVERFWRTLNEDLIEDTTFENIEEFKQELYDYLFYYNEYRLHSALGHKTPQDFNNNLPVN